ncbi:uncharacterized protein LOC126836655 isoform X1 [Adelges cooleyi]|uniref:uncharacterized protein LOC126836655 isoform X1 n=1 Tax=Adelges cooleyi TaxID=133065 RepID=UPI0021804630|nr:uncharacterized protein LOC126836655 isoform X1 [Adelges cooleyi]
MKRYNEGSFTCVASKRLKTIDVYDEFDLDTIKDYLDGEMFGENNPRESLVLIDAIFDALLLNERKIVDEVFNHILNVINHQDIREKIKELILCRLSTYVYRLTTNQLLQLVERCYKDIKSCKKNYIQSWVYIIPGVLKNISETSILHWQGKFYPGHAYKTIIINDILCSVNEINVDVIVPIAMMLRYTLLTEIEATKVIKCLCIICLSMDASDVPLLLKHMLYIGTSKDTLYILVALQKYFDSQNGQTPGDDMFDSECNVLFILEDYSKMNASFVNCVFKYIKMCKRAPDKVLSDFLLAFLLAISNCRTYENDVLKHLKELIIQSYFDDELLNCSFWLKKLFSKNNCEQKFKCLINNDKILSYKGVINGLIKLALSLLNTKRVVTKNDKEIIEKVHRLGTFILISVLEKKQYTYITTYVLKMLTESSFQSTSTPAQYLECLHVLCKSQYAKLIENNGDLLRLIRGMPLGQTHKVLHATKIVFKSSTIVKNNIMIMLRKELQSKDLLVRCSAVNGLLEILRSVFNSTNHFIEDNSPGLFTQLYRLEDE